MSRENSGLIDLDALMKEASSPELPASEPSSPSVSADDSLEAIETPVPVPEVHPRPHPPEQPPPPSPARLSTPVAAPRRSRWPLAVLALAASGILVLVIGRTRERETHASVVAASPTTAERAPPPSPVASSERGISASDLPMVAASAASSSTIATTTASAARPSATFAAIADVAKADAGDLGSAMRDAVGTQDAGSAPTETSTDGVNARQVRPSPGAVIGAINSVLPEARACLGPDDPARGATIVFKSDGSVARVDVSGHRPTDDCVREALAKAHTAPFIDDTFAARTTVRP